MIVSILFLLFKIQSLGLIIKSSKSTSLFIAPSEGWPKLTCQLTFLLEQPVNKARGLKLVGK